MSICEQHIAASNVTTPGLCAEAVCVMNKLKECILAIQFLQVIVSPSVHKGVSLSHCVHPPEQCLGTVHVCVQV